MNNNNNDDPPRCATGCGFYGNPSQQNLCSKCYRDSLKNNNIVVTQSEHEQPSTTTTTTATASTATTTLTDNDKNNNNNNVVDVNKKNKCNSCKKRVGLTGFECKCGEVYCGSHRYPELHACPFDFKTQQRDSLSKTLYSAADCKADKLHYRL